MRRMLLLMMTLMLLCGAAGAAAEDAPTGFAVQVGKASFEMPADMMVLYQDDTGLIATGMDYDLWIRWEDWSALTEELEGYTAGGVQQDNLYALYLAQTGDPEIAAQMAELGELESIGMLNGADVMMVVQDGMVLCSHYYRGSGFMVRLMPLDSGDMEAWAEICRKIALSFRLEGVSEEQMIADQVKWVVVTADTARIRNKPDISAGELKLARKGDRFELVRQEGAWYIVMINGRTGYIHSGVTEIQSGAR